MSDADINRIQQDIEQLQDQNAIDFQQWKRLGQEIEKLDEKIKTSDCRLNLLIKKIKADYENLKEKITEDIGKTKKDIETDYANLKQVMIDENAQAYLNNKIDTAVTEINSQLDNIAIKNSENATKYENIQLARSCTTYYRPKDNLTVGTPVFDTTLGKPIWCKSVTEYESDGVTVKKSAIWVDASGTEV